MKRLVDRYVPLDPDDMVTAMTALVQTIPDRASVGAQAVVVFPGQGEDWREEEAVRLVNASPNARYLLVAGSYSGEKCWERLTVTKLRRRYSLRRDVTVIIQPHATNTAVQARWVAREVKRHDITSIALVVSPYHLTRAYLSLLAVLYKKTPLNIEGVPGVVVIPHPVDISPAVIIPETGLTGAESLPGEITRIKRYLVRGWVATLDQLVEYLAWAYQQPILAKSSVS